MKKLELLTNYLIKYTILYSLTLTLAIGLIRYIFLALNGKLLNMDDLMMSASYIVLFTTMATIGTRHRYKDAFRFVTSNSPNIDNDVDSISNTIAVDCLTLDDVLILLKETDLILTLVDKENKIIKLRQRFKAFNVGCGTMIRFDEANKQMIITSFAFDYNKKLRAKTVNQQLSKLIGIEGLAQSNNILSVV